MKNKSLKHFLSKYRISIRYFRWHRGVNVCKDINLTCPNSKINIVFDVGAHMGQSSLHFKKFWKNAIVYAFEPTNKTFQILKKQSSNRKRIIPVNKAMSSKNGSATFVTNETGSSNHIIFENETTGTSSLENVELMTIDSFCLQQNIKEIDFLKIDTEGHEMDVLFGSEKMLSENKIKFIKTELGVDDLNSRHINYKEVESFLSKYGYKVFGIYDQENEFFRKEPQLRRFDMVFIHNSEIQNNSNISNQYPMTLLDLAIKTKQLLRKFR